MGAEIIVITIFQLWIAAYASLVRIVRFFAVKAGVIETAKGSFYKLHAVVVFIIALLPSLSFLWAISDDYDFAIGYILVIQTPIIFLTLWVLMAVHEWSNLTNQLTTRLRRRTH